MENKTVISLRISFEGFTKSEEKKVLNDALEQGEQSGFMENFNPTENLKELHRQCNIGYPGQKSHY